jgi:hypothetical protein
VEEADCEGGEGMTHSDIQDLINYIDDKAPKYATELPDVNGKPTMDVVVKVNDIMELLTKYASDVMSAKKEHTVGPNYEDMYNRCLDSLEEMRNENRDLKARVNLLSDGIDRRDAYLDVYAAALSTVEVMTGNKFNFELRGGTE